MDEQRPDPAAAAREEGARQAVMLAAMLIAAPVTILLERWLSRPDAARELRMRAAKQAERLSARLAAGAWRLAESARRAYEREAGG